MSAPIVLGYDGSPSADAALEETVRLAAELHAKVVVVFGYYVTPLGGQGGADVRAALEALGEEDTSRAVARLRAAGLEADALLVPHKPADAILQVAEETEARMIVVGTRGEGPITGAILGSVVLKLVQRAPIPLLVVPC